MLVCAHAPLPCRQIRVAARMRLLVSHFLLFRYRCFVLCRCWRKMASDLSPASAPCFSAANFVFLCCFSVTMVLQSRYVVFFSDVEVFSVPSGLCVVLKDGFALMALLFCFFPRRLFPGSLLVFPVEFLPLPCRIFL